MSVSVTVSVCVSVVVSGCGSGVGAVSVHATAARKHVAKSGINIFFMVLALSGVGRDYSHGKRLVSIALMSRSAVIRSKS